MIKRRVHFIVCVSLLAFSLLSSPMSLKTAISSNHSKIMVSFLGEERESNFENIYFLDKAKKISKFTSIWNGGCCHDAIIEEFHRDGKRFKRSRSYTLDIEKRDELPKIILCDKSIVKTNIEPTHQAVEGYSVAEIEENYILEEPVPFAGCQKK